MYEDDEEITVFEPPVSALEKLKILHAAINLLDVTRPEHADIHKGLRKFQREIRESKLVQTTIDKYFPKS